MNPSRHDFSEELSADKGCKIEKDYDSEPASSLFGERIIRLFVYLLQSRRRVSLDDLANAVGMPKATVHRLVDAIEAAGFKVRHTYYGDNDDWLEYEDSTDWGDLDDGEARPSAGRKKVLYWLEKLRSDTVIHPPALVQREIEALRMCKVFAKRLLGVDLSARAEVALTVMESLAKRRTHAAEGHYAASTLGTIDYSAKRDILLSLIQALEARKICRITYKSPWRGKAVTFHVMPLKIFCHKDALYLQTKKAAEPGHEKSVKPAFDPLLAIHRIKKVEITDQEFPVDELQKFDFEKAYNRAFGVIKEKEFKVVAEFTDWAATYVQEREWGAKQKITKREDGRIIIEFKASSEPETLAWILQFGEQGRLLQPASLVKELARITSQMNATYIG